MKAKAAAASSMAGRTYTSPLRERQAEQTRELILRAATEQFAAAGFDDFNMPALARQAGVSLRTLYRYFPTKDTLLDDLAAWLDDQISVRPNDEPMSAGNLSRIAEETFKMFDGNETVLLAQWATRTGRALRDRGRSRRLAAYRSALAEVTSHLPRSDGRAGLAVISYLLSSWTWKTMKEEFDMSGAESGKAVSWAINLVIEDLRRRNEQAMKRPTDGAKR